MRTPAWVALATALHALAIAALLWIPIRRPREPESTEPPTPVESTEIAVTLDEPEQPPSANEANEAPAVASSERTALRRFSARERATAEIGSAPEAPSKEALAAPNGSAAPGGMRAIPFTAAELGIGAPSGNGNRFLPRAEEKPPAGGPDHPAARAMRGTGLAHDRELGLGPEGPAIAALSDATSRSIAPLKGRAVFVVRTAGDGLVLGIDLLDSDGGPGWGDAGRLALESMRGKKMVVPRGATGMNMHIEIRSDLKLPNGESAPVGARLGENEMPEFTIPDPSNIGAKPRRVIHARSVGTDLL